VFLPDPARYGQHNDIFPRQDPINSAAHCGDVSPIRTGQNHGAAVRREQSGDHSQAIETKTLTVCMSDDDLANVADFAGFVDFARRLATARPVPDPPVSSATGT
jgi:hypothetical protein